MESDDYLLLLGIKHYKYCLRRWALVHIEAQWQENALYDSIVLEIITQRRSRR